MTSQNKEYKNEYLSCIKLKDYERYFLKYRGCKDNPFVSKAVEQIEIRSRISMPIRIIFLLFSWGICGCLIYVICLVNGTTNDFLGFIGFASVIGALASFIFGIVIICSPIILARIKEEIIG